MPEMGFNPTVLIRTSVATDRPLDPGVQHVGDFSDAYRKMLKHVRVVDLISARDVVPEYEKAATRQGATILVEHMERYA
jgi:hypothetical protein